MVELNHLRIKVLLHFAVLVGIVVLVVVLDLQKLQKFLVFQKVLVLLLLVLLVLEFEKLSFHLKVEQ